jgi:hypothetical protein
LTLRIDENILGTSPIEIDAAPAHTAPRPISYCSEVPMPRPAPVVEPNDVDWMIIEHGGDIRAALEVSMTEVERLRHELALASLAVSSGFTRGWQPTIATDGNTQG